MKKNNRYYEGGKYWEFRVSVEDFMQEYRTKYPAETIEGTQYEDQLLVNGELKEFAGTREFLDWAAWTAVHNDLEDLLDYDEDDIFIDWEQGE